MGSTPDTEFYAFGEDGPWNIDATEIEWLEGLDELRAATQAEVPRLTTRRALPPIGRFLETARHLGAALLLWQLRERPQGDSISRAGLSRRLKEAFEILGPGYIKLAQIVSSGRGLFPDELVAQFRLLRDQVKAEPFDTVQRVVEADLGAPLETVFRSFDTTCLAAASIAQVHCATLHTGESVVVKVQRPRVSERVRQDIAAMAWIAPFLTGRIPVAALANPPALVELFAETILEELDFRLEAENMLDIARLLKEAKQTVIVVPRPHPRLVTRRVLVMERLSGFTYDDVASMKEAGVDTTALMRALIVAFLEGAMIYGVFHGDLHGGNLFVMPNGRIALFDYGMTARMDETRRLAFLRIMMLGMMGDLRGQIAAYRDLGALKPDTDIDLLIKTLKLDQPVIDPTKLNSEQLTREIQYVTKALLGYGARLPKPLMLFVKNMLFMDDALSHLAPDVNIFAEVLNIYAYFAENHADKITLESGLDPTQQAFDMRGFKASLGITADVDAVTHRDLQKRRDVIKTRLEEAR